MQKASLVSQRRYGNKPFLLTFVVVTAATVLNAFTFPWERKFGAIVERINCHFQRIKDLCSASHYGTSLQNQHLVSNSAASSPSMVMLSRRTCLRSHSRRIFVIQAEAYSVMITLTRKRSTVAYDLGGSPRSSAGELSLETSCRLFTLPPSIHVPLFTFP